MRIILFLILYFVICSAVDTEASKIAVSPAKIHLDLGESEIVRIFNPNQYESGFESYVDGDCAYVEKRCDLIAGGGSCDAKIFSSDEGECIVIFSLINKDMISPSAAVRVIVNLEEVSDDDTIDKKFSFIIKFEEYKGILLSRTARGVYLLVFIVALGLGLIYIVKPELIVNMRK